MTDKYIRVGMDLRPLLKEGSGVGHYIKGLVLNLVNFKDIRLKLFSCSFKDRFDKNKHFPGLDVEIFDKRIPVTLMNLLWNYLSYPPIERWISEIDIFHSPHCYYIPGRCKNQIITIHDLFHIKNPKLTGIKNPTRELKIIKRAATKARKIIADSTFTKNEIRDILDIPEEKIEVIYLAPTLEPDANKLIREKHNKVKTILSVGTVENRKNYINLIEAFKITKNRIKDIRLIISGKDGFGAERIKERVSHLSSSPNDITLAGYLEESELERQYYNADLFVFPSHEEGFGLPPLDAMNFEVPVISSNTGALPEILKDAAYYIDKDDPASIAEGIIKILEDRNLARDLTSKGKKLVTQYSWAKTAQSVYRIYRNISEDI